MDIKKTKNVLKAVTKYSLPGMIVGSLKKGNELIQKKGYENEAKKIGLDKSLAEQKRLQALKEKVKKAGDDSLELLKDTRRFMNAKFTSNPSGKEYDAISKSAGKNSYDFGGGNTNKPEVKKERLGLYKDLGN